MKVRCVNRLAYTLIMLFTCLNSYSQDIVSDKDKLIQDLSDYISKEMKNSNVVGLSIAVVDDQEIYWAEGFGYADKMNDIKATPKTIYRVASISKLFTSLAVMQLAEKKLIDIDDPIKKYIPDFAIKTRFEGQGEITARNVMTHHAGLPSDIYNGFFSENPKPYTSIINYLNEEHTCSPPDYCFSYSNPGYSLLGCLVEQVSGQSFIDYTKKNIFKPMGMKNTSFELTSKMEELYSDGYAKGMAYKEPDMRDLPAGLLYSNVTDLASFMKMFFNNGVSNENQIIQAETIKEMLTPQNTNVPLDLDFRIGLTWFLSDKSQDWTYAGGIAEHGGDTYVYHASLVTLPKQKLGVVVLTNTDTGNKIAGKIAKYVLKETLEMTRNLKAPDDNEKPLAKTKVNYVHVKKKKLLKFQGDYLLGTTTVNVVAKRNKLVSNYGGMKVILKLNENGAFIPRLKLFGFIPLSQKKQQIKFYDISGIKSVLFFSDNNKDSSIAGIKVVKKEITETWKKRLGKYTILNDDSDFKLINEVELTLNNGFIVLRGKDFIGGTVKMFLTPLSDNEAIVEGIGRSTGYTLTFEDNKIFFSGLKLKKILKE
jgi:CubicO group peptidase (beta-lactamase class C family)